MVDFQKKIDPVQVKYDSLLKADITHPTVSYQILDSRSVSGICVDTPLLV